MYLKNYTCGVPVAKTISRIEMLLAESGASNVSKNFSNGELVSLTFSVALNGKSVTFKMPSDSEKIFNFMWKEVKQPTASRRENLIQQARRTAWKLLQDSLEVECTRLKLQQVDFIQVFLPYVWNGTQTYYEALKDSGFKQLQLTDKT